MASIGDVSTKLGAYIETGALGRFIPEPRSRAGQIFRSVLNGVSSMFGRAAGGIAGIDPGYQELLNRQIEAQQQMQLVSLESNIEKSKHETQMAAIRNIRVG